MVDYLQMMSEMLFWIYSGLIPWHESTTKNWTPAIATDQKFMDKFVRVSQLIIELTRNSFPITFLEEVANELKFVSCITTTSYRTNCTCRDKFMFPPDSNTIT